MMGTSLEANEFRRTMGLFATGVTVVATKLKGDLHAMTANAVTSVSLDPLLVLVCVGKAARMAQYLMESSNFSINFLRAEQQVLSTYFAGGWKEDEPPPFRFIPWEAGIRLEGCLAALSCVCHERVEGGDHWIVIGQVNALHLGIEPRHPLLFYEGHYGRLDTEARPPAPDLTWVEVPVQVFYDPWQTDKP